MFVHTHVSTHMVLVLICELIQECRCCNVLSLTSRQSLSTLTIKVQLEAIKHPHSTVSASCRFFCKYAVISCVVCKASKEVKIAVKTVQDYIFSLLLIHDK